jgi:hypothetical protein
MASDQLNQLEELSLWDHQEVVVEIQDPPIIMVQASHKELFLQVHPLHLEEHLQELEEVMELLEPLHQESIIINNQPQEELQLEQVEK